ncbi:MAG: diaminopimelate epimerase [Promethearchaeota archaeon]
MENLEFEKYHGSGNDYVIINDIQYIIPEKKKSELAKKLCQFHFSIGADGLIFICNSNQADIRMRIFNNDGSEAEMCGNGIRCFSKYVYEHDIVRKECINIETFKGVLTAELNIKEGIVKTVKIDMGQPILKCEDIPIILNKNEAISIKESIEILDKEFIFACISMGNPHAVIFTDDLPNDDDLVKYGSIIECHEYFPKRINVEFVRALSENEGILRVFERGVGITKSCGTGACASVVAGSILGIFKKNTPITIHNDGGDLKITFSNKGVLMEGHVNKVFSGVLEKIEI